MKPNDALLYPNPWDRAPCSPPRDVRVEHVLEVQEEPADDEGDDEQQREQRVEQDTQLATPPSPAGGLRRAGAGACTRSLEEVSARVQKVVRAKDGGM